MHAIYISGTLVFHFPVSTDLTDGNCGLSLVSDRNFNIEGYFNNDVNCTVLSQ